MSTLSCMRRVVPLVALASLAVVTACSQDAPSPIAPTIASCEGRSSPCTSAGAGVLL
jgi:hypothetical protein